MTATTRTRHQRSAAGAMSARAAAAGRVARAERARLAGRAEPPRRNPELYEVRPTAATVAMLEAVIDADPGLVDFVAANIVAARTWAAETAGRPALPGRTPDLELRTALIAFLLLAHKEPNFHVLNLPGLLGSLPADARRRLGIDRMVKVPTTGLAGTPARFDARQVTYRQLLTCLHNIADAFDPTMPGLDETEAARRAAAQQELVLRAVNAPRRALLPDWAPDGTLAGDATMKWAWERPPGRQGKIIRRGADGDGGPPRSLNELVGPEGGLTNAGIDPDGAAGRGAGGPVPGVNRHARRRLRRAQLARSAATWVGRKNKADSIYGYALHTLVTGDTNGPCLITHLALTPATANPAASLLPLVRHVHDTNLADNPSARPLRDVTADGAYTGTAAWQLGLRALGASPIFRLHPTNQEGRRQVGAFAFLNGRPICECCPAELDEPWPAFKNLPTRAVIAAHHQVAGARRAWEWKANGPAKASGSRQFLAPHRGTGPDGNRGGCEHCVHADGTPVAGEHGLPKQRCCTVATKTFTAAELVLYQDETFGTKEWYDRWNVRDRVEGTYGVMKNLGLTNYGRDYHHFIGQGPEALVAMFASMAHNMHMIASWLAQQAAATEREQRSSATMAKPSATPTQTRRVDSARTKAKTKNSKKSSTNSTATSKTKCTSSRGPKGLAELGDDPPRRH